jgi:hypothetical protein
VGRIRAPSGYLPHDPLRDSLIGIWERRPDQGDINMEHAAQSLVSPIAKSKPKQELFEIKREDAAEVLFERFGKPNYDWQTKEAFDPDSDPERFSSLYPGRTIDKKQMTILSGGLVEDMVLYSGQMRNAYLEVEFGLLWIDIKHSVENKNLDRDDAAMILSILNTVTWQMQYDVFGFQDSHDGKGLVLELGFIQPEKYPLLMDYKTFYALIAVGCIFDETSYCHLNAYFFNSSGMCEGVLNEYTLWRMAGDELREYNRFIKKPIMDEITYGKKPNKKELEKLFNSTENRTEEEIEKHFNDLDSFVDKLCDEADID